MREWEIGAVENIHGALPYIRFAPILALVGVGVNRIGKACSMTAVSFYHLESTSLDRALPSLLEKVLERGHRAVVIAGSEERVEALEFCLMDV